MPVKKIVKMKKIKNDVKSGISEFEKIRKITKNGYHRPFWVLRWRKKNTVLCPHLHYSKIRYRNEISFPVYNIKEKMMYEDLITVTAWYLLQLKKMIEPFYAKLGKIILRKSDIHFKYQKGIDFNQILTNLIVVYITIRTIT